LKEATNYPQDNAGTEHEINQFCDKNRLVIAKKGAIAGNFVIR
jgi:hypothetical protein